MTKCSRSTYGKHNHFNILLYIWTKFSFDKQSNWETQITIGGNLVQDLGEDNILAIPKFRILEGNAEDLEEKLLAHYYCVGQCYACLRFTLVVAIAQRIQHWQWIVWQRYTVAVASPVRVIGACCLYVRYGHWCLIFLFSWLWQYKWYI